MDQNHIGAVAGAVMRNFPGRLFDKRTFSPPLSPSSVFRVFQPLVSPLFFSNVRLRFKTTTSTSCFSSVSFLLSYFIPFIFLLLPFLSSLILPVPPSFFRKFVILLIVVQLGTSLPSIRPPILHSIASFPIFLLPFSYLRPTYGRRDPFILVHRLSLSRPYQSESLPFSASLSLPVPVSRLSRFIAISSGVLVSFQAGSIERSLRLQSARIYPCTLLSCGAPGIFPGYTVPRCEPRPFFSRERQPLWQNMSASLPETTASPEGYRRALG